jgi:hypothetical protein
MRVDSRPDAAQRFLVIIEQQLSPVNQLALMPMLFSRDVLQEAAASADRVTVHFRMRPSRTTSDGSNGWRSMSYDHLDGTLPLIFRRASDSLLLL